MNFHQGDDIAISIQLEKKIDTDRVLSDFSRIKLFAYTDSCFVSKFSYPATAGFHPLTLGDENTIFGAIPSNDTKRMSGNIIIEVMFEADSEFGDLKENASRKVNTGVFVKKTLIKNEI